MQQKVYKSAAIFCMALLCAPCMCAASGTDGIDARIAEFMGHVTCQPVENYDKAIKRFETVIATEINSEEDSLVVANVALLERINGGVIAKNEAKAALQKAVAASEAYMTNHKNCSKTFYTSLADVQARLVNFSSGKDMLQLASDAKKNYEKALRIDAKYTPALNGYGLWCYFAPAIAGGGENAALKQLNKAIKMSGTDYDKFIAYINRSQVYFAFGKEKESAQDLAKAAAIYPKSGIPKIAAEKNAQGVSFFE